MDEKEIQIQKAVDSRPEFTYSQCLKDFFIDEKWLYNGEGGHNVVLCTMCATAQFVADRLCGKAQGIFTKPHHDG